jgi:hypothetical protein
VPYATEIVLLPAVSNSPADAQKTESGDRRPHASSPPWSIDKDDACFIVRDANRKALRYTAAKGKRPAKYDTCC